MDAKLFRSDQEMLSFNRSPEEIASKLTSSSVRFRSQHQQFIVVGLLLSVATCSLRLLMHMLAFLMTLALSDGTPALNSASRSCINSDSIFLLKGASTWDKFLESCSLKRGWDTENGWLALGCGLIQTRGILVPTVDVQSLVSLWFFSVSTAIELVAGEHCMPTVRFEISFLATSRSLWANLIWRLKSAVVTNVLKQKLHSMYLSRCRCRWCVRRVASNLKVLEQNRHA